jgi:hypothetical protein
MVVCVEAVAQWGEIVSKGAFLLLLTNIATSCGQFSQTLGMGGCTI